MFVLYGEYVVLFFLPFDHGLEFLHSLCENSINQSIKNTMYCVAIPFILGVRFVDASAGVTLEEGRIGFFNLPSEVLVLIFVEQKPFVLL